jgi:hypothetical protein
MAVKGTSYRVAVSLMPEIIHYLCTMRKVFSFILSIPVYIYRYMIGPLLPKVCRHEPSCSQFMLDALRIHGPIHGFAMGLNRILRCRPGGTHGFDPVELFRFKRYKPFRIHPSGNRLKPPPHIRSAAP